MIASFSLLLDSKTELVWTHFLNESRGYHELGRVLPRGAGFYSKTKSGQGTSVLNRSECDRINCMNELMKAALDLLIRVVKVIRSIEFHPMDIKARLFERLLSEKRIDLLNDLMALPGL